MNRMLKQLLIRQRFTLSSYVFAKTLKFMEQHQKSINKKQDDRKWGACTFSEV